MDPIHYRMQAAEEEIKSSNATMDVMPWELLCMHMLGADDVRALGLDPVEPPADGRLHLALHRVRLVPGHPPPPLHLRRVAAPQPAGLVLLLPPLRIMLLAAGVGTVGRGHCRVLLYLEMEMGGLMAMEMERDHADRAVDLQEKNGASKAIIIYNSLRCSRTEADNQRCSDSLRDGSGILCIILLLPSSQPFVCEP